jgi:hypothetical protein
MAWASMLIVGAVGVAEGQRNDLAAARAGGAPDLELSTLVGTMLAPGRSWATPAGLLIHVEVIGGLVFGTGLGAGSWS